MLRITNPGLQQTGTSASPPGNPSVESELTVGDLASKNLTVSKTPFTFPKISFEANTPAGKLIITDIQLDNPFSRLVTTGHYALENFRERLGGVKNFSQEDAEQLIAMNVLDSAHWITRPTGSSAMAPYKSLRNSRAVAGGLSYRIPGLDSFPLFWNSSALQALAALVAIGTLDGLPEDVISSVVDGAISGLYGTGTLPDYEFTHKRLSRFLADIYSASRKKVGDTFYQMLVPHMLDNIPSQVRKYCSTTEEELEMLGIKNSRLKNIVSWAFSIEDPRDLFLNNRSEILAAALVLSCMRDPKVAVVDCEAGKVVFQKVADIREQGCGLVIYTGGNAQRAIALLDRQTWKSPEYLPPPTEQPPVGPLSRLACPPSKVLRHCQSFLESNGVAEDAAASLVNAIKKDAIVQFSKPIRIHQEELPGYSYYKENNTMYSYSYEGIPIHYNWLDWFGETIEEVDKLVLGQPVVAGIQFGSITFYGYAAKVLSSDGMRDKIHRIHSEELEVMAKRKVIATDSNISAAVGEAAGLIYALALSSVHLQTPAIKNLRTELGTCYRDCYNAIAIPPGTNRLVPRHACLGVLSCLWLGLPGVWISEWPCTSLGISNGQGSVLSAVLVETRSLREATTKFVISVDVPDMMVASQPVVACASQKRDMVDGRGHEIGIKARNAKPFNTCGSIGCLTICGGDTPQLSEKRLANRVLAVPVVGYVVCGSDWYDYVDLDDAFAVMVESQDQKVCTESACEEPKLAYWVEAEDFLKPAKNDSGFTCCVVSDDKKPKIVLPATGEGLKQAFLCGVFRKSADRFRFIDLSCIEHAEGRIIIA